MQLITWPWNSVVVILALIVLNLALAGCVSSSAFKRADCQRSRFPGFIVLACDDRAVGEHCRRGDRSVVSPHVWIAGKTDTGKPVDYYPRACLIHRPAYFGRKKVMAIGKSHLGCVLHEKCHFDFPDDPAKCEREYPCLGDK